MSTILGANSVQVCNAPLNNSVSKQMYSFPKAKRFDEKVNKSLCDKLYDLPDIKDKRSTSIGYGQKTDVTQTGI